MDDTTAGLSAAKRLCGTTVEGVRVGEVIGQGGAGYVYRCHHEGFDMPVALKILTAAAENNDNFHAHFRQEARLLARLHHPNIVRAYHFFEGQVDGLVLELVDGQSLGRLCIGRPMAWQRACRLALQCCDAVGALHALGFIHRDLNPGNFMLEQPGTDDERIKLIDLGTAKNFGDAEPLADSLEHTTTLVPVTARYMTPEFASGNSRGDISGDTYGLAATLYSMVTGRAPFDFDGDMELLTRRVAQEPPFIPLTVSMPPTLRQLLLRGLDKDPTRRFATPAELAAALREVLSPQTAENTRRLPAALDPATPPAPEPAAPAPAPPAPAPPAPAPAPPRPTRSRWSMLGVLGGAATAAAGLVAALMVGDVAAVPHRLQLDEANPPAPLPSHATPERPATRPPPPPVSPPTQPRVDALLGQLRKCPSSPRGPLLLEFGRDGLRSLDLVPLDLADPWHRCARRILRPVAFFGQVDVRL